MWQTETTLQPFDTVTIFLDYWSSGSVRFDADTILCRHRPLCFSLVENPMWLLVPTFGVISPQLDSAGVKSRSRAFCLSFRSPFSLSRAVTLAFLRGVHKLGSKRMGSGRCGSFKRSKVALFCQKLQISRGRVSGLATTADCTTYAPILAARPQDRDERCRESRPLSQSACASKTAQLSAANRRQSSRASCALGGFCARERRRFRRTTNAGLNGNNEKSPGTTTSLAQPDTI
jgi:hypothetical protein